MPIMGNDVTAESVRKAMDGRHPIIDKTQRALRLVTELERAAIVESEAADVIRDAIRESAGFEFRRGQARSAGRNTYYV